jgi:hypothetical protein
MESGAFRQALGELEEWARGAPTAIMCAEALYLRCHRQLLADALLARGFEVVHILGEEETRIHRLPAFARTEGARVVYDGGILSLDLPEGDLRD